MVCSNCDNKTNVNLTIQYAGTTIRHRKCKKCGLGFYTEEVELTDNDFIREALRFKNERR